MDRTVAPSEAGDQASSRIGSRELLALLGMSTSAAALGIDTMLPAFADIRSDLGLDAGSTAIGAIISSFFAGLAVGQLVYGPLADRFGRRPVLRLSLVAYAALALLAALAPSFGALVAIRFAWGVAAAGPRVVAMAIVRDSYEGTEVSQAMSSLMAVFILVPIIAPIVGAGIVAVSSWRWLFGFCGLFALVLVAWSFRLHETLRPEHRLELSARRVAAAARSVVTNRAALGYLLAVTFLMTSFVAYLSGFEPIIDQTYDLVEWFPVIFAVLAAVMGVFMVANRRLVGRFGPAVVARTALAIEIVIAAALSAVAATAGGEPPLAVVLVGLAGLLACNALVLPNLTSLAIEPMGAIAGTASSVIGATQTGGAALVASAVLVTYDGSVTPLALTFVGSSIASLVWAFWARGASSEPTATV